MLRRAKSFAVRLWRDEKGASLLEYSVLIGIILAVTVAAVIFVGSWANTQWTVLKTGLEGSPNQPGTGG
jgi:pilus assembly protein Flp/PilA